MIKKQTMLVIALLLISSCVSNPESIIVSETSGQIWEQEVIKWIEDSKRISTISSKIFVEGKEYCKKLDYLMAYIGIKVWSKDNFEKKWHSQARQRFSLDEQIKILHIVPSSPADVAGFQVGDVLLKINSVPISDQRIFISESNNKDSIGKPAAYSITRGNQNLVITVEPQPACKGDVYLVMEDSKIFQNNDSNIFISTGMMSVIDSDEDIALIVSHELSHNARKHRESNKSVGFLAFLIGSALDGILEGWGDKVTKGRGYSDVSPDTSIADGLENVANEISVSQEQQAITDTLYLMANAGLDINQASISWRKLEQSIDPIEIETFRYYHPLVPNRDLEMEKIKKEIENKRQAGMTLSP